MTYQGAAHKGELYTEAPLVSYEPKHIRDAPVPYRPPKGLSRYLQYNIESTTNK